MNLLQACLTIWRAYQDGRLTIQSGTVRQHEELDSAMSALDEYINPKNDRR